MSPGLDQRARGLDGAGDPVPDALLEQAGGNDQAAAAIASASDNLGELYGEPTAFGIYGKADGSGLVTVTIGPGEPGLFVPDGAPVSADVQGAARAALEVVRVDAELDVGVSARSVVVFGHF